MQVSVLIMLFVYPLLVTLSDAAYAEGGKGLEIVRGHACYGFGDDQTPAQARRGAMIKAQEDAVRNHGVFVKSSSRIKNFQLEEDIIQTTSAAMLQEITVEKEERKPQELCLTLRAKISSISVEDMIKQRIAAKEIAQEARTTLVPAQPKFGLKIWTNKPDGHFIEGEKLIVYVQSERDAYLKLDYFQADGTVTHLVPNIYRGQAFIVGGKTYSFGDETSPEQYVINEPYGAETIKAITGVQPFEAAADEAGATGDSRNYLGRLRGIKVVAAASSVELSTESRTVAEYKKDIPKRTPSE
ncbi:MAG: DUF4384 domain-containing protein [Nitrospira sp.]|jgi:hypothetical protein|nr:DUF4384 domain-containing protein [Nitrospira sp.]MDI3462591.1 hypothetical protein [Nitrospira sp.]